MKTVAIFSVFFIVAAFGQDNPCKSDFQTAFTCVRTEFQNGGGVQKFKDDFRKAVQDCFATAKCSPPNFDADPFADAPFMNKIVNKFESLSDTQRDCIRAKIRDRILPKIKDCLTDQNEKTYVDDAWNQLQSQIRLTDAQKSDLKQAARVQVNILKASQNCADGVNLGKCLINASAQARNVSCKFRQDCAKGISQDCRTKVNKFRDDICPCIQKAKQDIQNQLQAADNSPLAALSALQTEAGSALHDLSECVSDATSFANELRPDVEKYVLQKCKDANYTPKGLLPPMQILDCMKYLKDTKGDAVKSLFGTLKDYLERQGPSGGLCTGDCLA